MRIQIHVPETKQTNKETEVQTTDKQNYIVHLL